MVDIIKRFRDAFCRARLDIESSEQREPFYAVAAAQAVEFRKHFKLSVLPKRNMVDVSVALGSIYLWNGKKWVLDNRFHCSKPLQTLAFLRGQIQAIEFAEYKEYRWASLQWGGRASMSQYQPTLGIGGALAKYEKHDHLLVALDVYSEKCRWGKRVWAEVTRVKQGGLYDAKISLVRPSFLPEISESEKTSMMRIVFPMVRAKRIFAWIVGGLALLGAIATWFNECCDFVQKVVELVSKWFGG